MAILSRVVSAIGGESDWLSSVTVSANLGCQEIKQCRCCGES